LSLADLMADVADLKVQAKLYRDAKDYDGAIVELQTAIELIERSGWDKDGDDSGPSDTQKKVAWHFADCLGMLGGNYRRIQQLDSAITCFKRGRVYEAKDSRYQIPSSYNTVNAIVAPIEARRRDATSQADELRRAIETLEYQIFDPGMAEDSRRQDRWAWADLGQCKLLLGDKEGAYAAYQRLRELADRSEIGSACNVLKSIHDALAEQGDPKAAVVEAGLDFLQSGLK